MGTVISDGRVAIVKYANGMQASTYKNEIECVLEMLDNASLGGDGCHGSEAHVVALAQVAKRVYEIRDEIDARVERELKDDTED